MKPGVVLRTIAVAIAAAAVIDPAITTTRRTKPVVEVLPASPADSAHARHIAAGLDRTFTVSRVPAPHAEATIIAGNRVPTMLREAHTPVFAVLRDHADSRLTIDAVDAPAITSVHARTPILVTLRRHGDGARGRSVAHLELRRGGVLVDRRHASIGGDSTGTIAMVIAAADTGSMALRISASVDGARDTAKADVVIDVRGTRRAIVFHDAQASWHSTFIRRAIQQDPRFLVASRVSVSRGISTTQGAPPPLDALRTAGDVDVIVIGAPSLLDAADVGALEAFMRTRGGSVVLLLDRTPSAAVRRLTHVEQWSSVTLQTPAALRSQVGDTATILAASLTFPARLPAGASVIASAHDGRSSAGRDVAWQMNTGAGRLIVIGATDAWHHRDPAQSGFARFWTALIAEAADAAVPAVDVATNRTPLLPGATGVVDIALRDTAATVNAVLKMQSGTVPIRLWPGAAPGTLHGEYRAPIQPGIYAVVVSGDGILAQAPVVTAVESNQPDPDDSAALADLTNARNGRIMADERGDNLSAAISRAIRPAPHRMTWHPMRSALWLVPFALALIAEWYWRRRRGLA